MTEDEWWRLIEEYTLAGDWTGLLVCADALQEQGWDGKADTLRWLAKKQLRVGLMVWRNGPEYYLHVATNPHKLISPVFKSLMYLLEKERNFCREYYA